MSIYHNKKSLQIKKATQNLMHEDKLRIKNQYNKKKKNIVFKNVFIKRNIEWLITKQLLASFYPFSITAYKGASYFFSDLYVTVIYSNQYFRVRKKVFQVFVQKILLKIALLNY